MWQGEGEEQGRAETCPTSPPAPQLGIGRAERGSQGAGTLLQPGTEGRAQGWGV